MLDRVKFTQEKIDILRQDILKLINDGDWRQQYADKLSVVTTGSFGRDEASEESDLDWYLVIGNDCGIDEEEIKTIKADLNEVIERHIKKEPGSTGTFGEEVMENSLYQNYGGDKDTNQAFTRRMLYLLESRFLFNETLYKEIKNKIISLYIKPDIPDANINRFMLNDIIRYYRTICTDYEYKVSEQGKAWGLRKIKLRFSRKLIYFSGIITVAETCNMTREEKIQKTLELLELPPLERIAKVVGPEHSHKFLESYSFFLEEISNPAIRDELDTIKNRDERNKSSAYRRLKNESNYFSQEIEKILSQHYTTSHPIHLGLIL
ncbi:MULTISPECIES: hypothetical protein [Aeromonas]|uniref:hypothetical protein n=1 Tax=Aeromonas TaxID=642 RepID=UPI001F377CAF|nr:hypothetical protein [Aeromonas veronii]MCF5901474.1 hypothetical protein [Aeromonas veronii]